MTQVKVKIDIKNGALEIEADAETFASAMDRAESVLDKFAKIDLRQDARVEGSEHASEPQGSDAIHSSDEEATSRAKKKRSSSSAKVASWKMVENLLPDEEKRKSLREFFEQKNPSGQNEKVAVLSCKLKELTGRDAFDGNEIYTAFQIVDQKTPGNLGAVFGNMTAAGLGNVADKKFRPNFKADDFVKHELPAKAAKK